MYLFKEYYFIKFVALITKIWPKILIFTITAKCWRKSCFCPPPFIQRSDRCNFKLFFYITTYINDAQWF